MPEAAWASGGGGKGASRFVASQARQRAGRPSQPVAIVGAGAVARALGRELHAAGVPVTALAGRTQASARSAAASIDAGVRVVTVDAVPRCATRVIIAVADAGIGSTAATLAEAGMRGIVLHTSGASGLAPCEPLRGAGVACGVLHPLQTVVPPGRGAGRLRGASFGVAGDDPAVAWAASVAECLGGRVLRLAADDLPAYHAGAVLASNAVTAVIDAATVLMAQAGVPRHAALEAIGPLCRASVDNALRLGPAAALTGPVVRGDTGTVAAHLAAIRCAPAGAAELYRAAARHLLTLAREREVSPPALQSLEQMLERGDGGRA